MRGLYLLDPFYIACREQSRTGLYRLSEVAPEHFELTEYYQRYFRVNVVADEIQFNCQLEGERTLCLSLGSKQPFNAQQIALLSLIQPWVLGLSTRWWPLHPRRCEVTGACSSKLPCSKSRVRN